MLKAISINIEEIYITVALRKQLDSAKAEKLAEKILENIEIVPIQVRKGEGRFVLIRGIHRLEALKLLGEKTVKAFIVSARQH